MSFIKGIDQTTNPEETPKGYIYWQKNGINNYLLDSRINEPGTLEEIDISNLNILFKNGVEVLGHNVILFYKDLNNNDCIAIIDTIAGTATVKVSRTDLNFLIDKPISCEAKVNPKGETVVAFVDGYNRNKYINLDTAVIGDPLNYYNLFPVVNSASKIETELIDSGAVPTGVYFITFQYIAKDRTRSTWTTISNPVYVTLVDPNQPYLETKGVNSGQASNKLIKITLKDIDTNYSKVAVAVISKINGVVTATLIKEVSISGTDLTFVYNGTESLGTLTVAELVTDNVVYITSEHITSVDDQLFLADNTTAEVEDFQLVANAVTIKWRSTLETINTVAGSSKFKDGNNNKTFIHDEVYAFYIQFELVSTGTFTEWFHIPGRAVGFSFETLSFETGGTSIETGGLEINGRTPYIYEVLDTASGGDTNVDGSKTGIMGFWQNSNEEYPANFPGMSLGTKVRHHKFPSVGHMRSIWGSNYGIDRLDTLGIDVTLGSLDSSKIKGWRIGYAKRTLADVGVIGMGLTIFAGYPEGGDKSYLMSPGGNFHLACIDGANDDILPNMKYIRFNSFDIWQDRPAISAAYLRNYIKLTANSLASTSGNYNGDETYGTPFPGSADFDMVLHACNFTKAGADNAVSTVMNSANWIRKLTEQAYIPHNVKYSQGLVTIDNRVSEETVLARISGGTEEDNIGLITIGELQTLSDAASQDPNLGEETYLAALKNPKSDYFIGFENQVIVVNPQIVRGANTGTFTYIGDGFVGVHSYVALAPYKNDLSVLTTDLHKSVINFHIHLGVSRHNVNQRYLTVGDYTTYFYPDAGLFTKEFADVDEYWFYNTNHSRDKIWNNFQYSKDFSTVNDLEVFGVYDRDSQDTNKFTHRIHRSTRANRESNLEDGWKTFKPLDYFDTVRDKGEIVNIEAWGTDALLIHHKRALFRTRDKAVLQTNIIDITLGSGDIFAIEPKEINPTATGTGGTQHKYSCKLTDKGYFFVDQDGYTVYLYDGQQLKDISQGLANFFCTRFNTTKDNPYNDEGIMLVYDPYYYRLILSHKAATNSFTVSYDLSEGEWVSAHDYLPDFIFNTRSNVYSFKANKLYTHNIGDYGNFYGQVYPFYVDFIINDSPNVQKVLSALYWITKYKISDRAVDQRKTITSITVWNDQGCTGKKDILTNETNSLFVDSNAKSVDEGWSFNDLNNNVIDPSLSIVDDLLADSRPIYTNIEEAIWYDSEPLRGKFFIVRLEYSNIENKELHLRELSGLLRKSNS